MTECRKGRTGQPGHEGGDFHRIPAPVTTPAQHIISPAPAQHQPQREEQPGHQRPAPGQSDPAVIGASGDQRGHRKGKRNDKGDEAQVKHGWVDDHARVAQQRVEAVAIRGSIQGGSNWLEHVRHHITARGSPQALEGILDENAQHEEEGQGDQRNHDHPGQKFAVTVPLAQRNCRSKGRHQPGPEDQRASLPAPQCGDFKVERHAIAGDSRYVVHFIMTIDQEVNNA